MCVLLGMRVNRRIPESSSAGNLNACTKNVAIIIIMSCGRFGPTCTFKWQQNIDGAEMLFLNILNSILDLSSNDENLQAPNVITTYIQTFKFSYVCDMFCRSWRSSSYTHSHYYIWEFLRFRNLQNIPRNFVQGLTCNQKRCCSTQERCFQDDLVIYHLLWKYADLRFVVCVVTYLERAHRCSDINSLPIGSAGRETIAANNRVYRGAFSLVRPSRCGCRAVVADKPVRICGRKRNT